MKQMTALKLGDFYHSFASRLKGREMTQQFAEMVEGTTGEYIVVSWDGVGAASPSFIDEFVGGIQETLKKDVSHKTIVFTGDNPYIIDLIDTILKRREFPVLYSLSLDDVEKCPPGMLGHPTASRAVPA